jgi:ATP-dependent RNA helicase DeaD
VRASASTTSASFFIDRVDAMIRGPRSPRRPTILARALPKPRAACEAVRLLPTDSKLAMTDSGSPSPADAASGPAPAPAEPAAKAPGFAALGLVPELVTALAGLGYEEPTPIQREAIPPLLAGRDLLGQAATGTGKTAAFALPLLQRALTGEPKANHPRALVLVPTRELAMQVAEAVHRYGKEKRASVLPIYGGQSIGQQLRVLDRGVEVVVATPGRALDHLKRGSLALADVKVVVLDEADEMLDMGFAEDLEAILGELPEGHQTALFSATLPPRILAIAKRYLRDPVRVAIARERPAAGEVPRVRQVAYVVPPAQKPAALGRVLDMEQPTSAIVFCRTRLEVDELCEAMNARGYRSEALHGGFAQEQRDRVMKRFRGGQTDLLVATDVAARGLDIEHVSHVVNYGLPSDPDDYVHRIGRTGRAGREGVAITFLAPRERRLLKNIGWATGQELELETIPTVADLRHRRLELTRASLREALLAGELEPYRALVEELASEHDALDVAAAAAKLAHEATHAASGAAHDEQDIELVPPPPRERPQRAEKPVWGQGGPRRERRERPVRSGGPRPAPHAHELEPVRLFIGAGRLDSIRPGDLVGAICNETSVPASGIGAIRITDRFSLVEVPADQAEHVIRALRGTTLRGRKVVVRRDLHS